MDDFTEQQVNDFKEAFRLFDRDGDGVIHCSEIGTVLRAIGQNPSETDLTEIVRDAENASKVNIDFPEFISLVSKQLKSALNEEDVKEAFKAFDKQGTGQISAGALKHYLTSIGEPLTAEQATQLLEDLQIEGTDTINYNQLVSALLAK